MHLGLENKDFWDHPIQKSIESEFCFAFFSKSIFSRKTSVSPPFLRDGKRDRAETFFTYTSHYLGWVLFFILRNFKLVDFGSLHKNCTSKKQQFFRVHRVFWLFYRKDKRYKETKKRTHPKQYPVPAKKVSTQSNIGPLRNWGEKLSHFYRLWPQNPIQDSIWELWV